MKKLTLAAASALAIVSASPASAAVITYTISGTFSGTTGAVSYTGQQATFTGIGDTSTLRTVNGFETVTLNSLTAADSNGVTTLTVLSPMTFIYDASFGFVAFANSTVTGQLFAIGVAGLSNYDGISNFGQSAPSDLSGPTSGADPYLSNLGNVSIDTVRQARFSASVVTAAVPEPATWAMMLVGFGMIGATARYRRRTTKIAYA